MCSIFGYVARRNNGPKYSALTSIIEANMARGPHAFGFAWIDSRGILHAYRQQGRMNRQLDILSLVHDARMLIGHLRWATDGDPSHNINNHPHACDGGWLVHNGIVSNHRRLIDRYGLAPVSECDSEVIGLLVENSKRETRLQRVAASIRLTTGPLAIMGLWSRPGVMMLARRGNPLHYSDTGLGLYFGSLAAGLPGRVRAVSDNQVIRVRRSTTGDVRMQTLALPSYQSERATLFDAATYRGG